MRIPRTKMERDAEGDERGKKSKKKVAIPKDRHAPKKPITAYNLYAADERIRLKKENPDRSFGEMNREIGSLWTNLSPEKKQPYLEQAEQNRQKYMKDVEAYQRSDQYKKYMQTVAALQKRQQQKKVEKEKKKKQKLSSSKPPQEAAPAESAADPPSLPPPSRPPPLSLKQSFVVGTEIPVFTNQFLLHNREVEVEVRKLRQATMDQEEENALLSRHIDNMKSQTDRLESDIQNQILKNQVLKQRLIFLQEMLSEAFGNFNLPGIDSVPSADTIHDYLKEVESVVAKQPADDKQPNKVVSTVRKVAKEMMERAREREGEHEEKMDTN